MPPANSSTSSFEAPDARTAGFVTIGWRAVLLLFVAGIALYLVVFGTLVSKPLTKDLNGKYLELKTRHLLSTAGQPRVVILAASNGRFSHRCETIEQAYGVSCTNMSMHVFVSMSWQIERLKPLLAPGDLVYMPLEYRGTWSETEETRTVGEEAPYVVRFARPELRYYSWRQRLDALFYFDLRYLISAVSEMALSASGVRQDYWIATLTAQGDESGHTAAKAKAYVAKLAGPSAVHPDVAVARDDRYWSDILNLLHWGAAHGVRVVGGLPTVFDEVDVPQDVVDALAQRFRANGGCFVALDNKSRYPRSSFYDTAYHLNEESQILHSLAVGRVLTGIMRGQGC